MLRDLVEEYKLRRFEKENERKRLKEETEKLEEKRFRIERQIARLQRQYRELHREDWVVSVIHPVAKAIAEKLGMELEIMGPFGVNSRVSLRFYSEDPFQPIKSITIRPCDIDKAKFLYETDERVYQFPEGSIGALNGGNIVTKQLPEQIDEIIPLLYEFIPKKGEEE